ncbi:MAG TPA: hypothetical protein VMV14_04730, partial [Acidimicrobiales bacterium]|nr:hypothetical protein [Acidimicrobiales bacterium]
VLTMVLPLVAVATHRWAGHNRSWARWRHLLLLVPVGVVISVGLTVSRSADLAVAGAVLLLALATGAPRWLLLAAGVGLVFVAMVSLFDPALIGSPFTAAAHSGSVQSRVDRLPILFGAVVHRPFTGVGYTALPVGVDDGYVLTYGQLGMVGMLSWGALLVATLVTAVRGLRASRRSHLRELAAACTVGVIGAMVAAATYDFTFTEQSMWTLALLGAFAVAVVELLPAPATPRRRSPLRLAWPVAGVVIGMVALAQSTVQWSRSYTVYVITPPELELWAGPIAAGGLSFTICDYLFDARPLAPGTTLSCQQTSTFVANVWPAQMNVRIGASSAVAVNNAARRAFSPFSAAGYPVVVPDGPLASGKPAWAQTAPVSGGVLGAVLALAIPAMARRRRHTGEATATGVTAAIAV